MAEDCGCKRGEKEKFKNDLLKKVEHLKEAAGMVTLPEDLRKDLDCMLKTVLCKLSTGSIEPDEVIEDLRFLEDALKNKVIQDIKAFTEKMSDEFARSSSCAILGDHCVRSTREVRLSDIQQSPPAPREENPK